MYTNINSSVRMLPACFDYHTSCVKNNPIVETIIGTMGDHAKGIK